MNLIILCYNHRLLERRRMTSPRKFLEVTFSGNFWSLRRVYIWGHFCLQHFCHVEDTKKCLQHFCFSFGDIQIEGQKCWRHSSDISSYLDAENKKVLRIMSSDVNANQQKCSRKPLFSCLQQRVLRCKLAFKLMLSSFFSEKHVKFESSKTHNFLYKR